MVRSAAAAGIHQGHGECLAWCAGSPQARRGFDQRTDGGAETLEATDNGLLAPELAVGITRVNGTKSKGVRIGNWLSPRQAQALP